MPKTNDLPIDVYLADLTHTGSIVASNVSPLGIGLIASFVKARMKNVEFELFKYPSDLSRALDRKIPKVVGFANYSWNLEIAYKYAEHIKKTSPESVVVFGGPNYGLTDEEIGAFWKNRPAIDFYIVLEGELAFLDLLQKLEASDFDASAIKSTNYPLGNCHYVSHGKVVKGPILPRIKDLSEIGSPYLQGYMDKFFDGVLIPMIHTTRGCPFTCGFCTEGNTYYSKVAQRFDLKDELMYIADRRKTVQDLVITDANFGMFAEDAAKARTLADVQKAHGWPKRILVSTGKNQKERVIEVAAILNGAISIAASLQSTDKQVLQNIKRSNISLEALNGMVRQSAQVDTPTYTEIILGLPGDTVQSHTQSLRDVTNAGLGIVRMYQLILLLQTELNTPEYRKRYGMKSKFRINPRSFGRYDVLGDTICAIESEEIVVETNTLSYQEYFECRELDLTVEILHNTGMFVELVGLCQWLNYPWFDFMFDFYKQRRSLGQRLASLYDSFTESSQKRLWDSKEALERDVEENIDRFLGDPSGTNEMAVSKAIAFFDLQDELHDILFSIMETVIKTTGRWDECFARYLDELKRFSKLRKHDCVTTSIDHSASFSFDFNAIKRAGFKVDPSEYQLAEPTTLRFFHSEEQKAMINGYLNQYGRTLDGLGRILMRASVKSLFRDMENARCVYPGLTMANFG
jgi:radical SAM superfamily enzyme YgiQ (UPF0313 family)